MCCPLSGLRSADSQAFKVSCRRLCRHLWLSVPAAHFGPSHNYLPHTWHCIWWSGVGQVVMAWTEVPHPWFQAWLALLELTTVKSNQDCIADMALRHFLVLFIAPTEPNNIKLWPKQTMKVGDERVAREGRVCFKRCFAKLQRAFWQVHNPTFWWIMLILVNHAPHSSISGTVCSC